ncbi:hypothetical protein EVAR_6321_1 [Eumeta japonica]|uniref:Uncharacterized protein n=1 Tax=Eumeta variegata TaxID=151549 RepID=A0A4C1TB21_EUMVA|nr:hypothetical protein EVAR_6321_1 [Eumeta japonica]
MKHRRCSLQAGDACLKMSSRLSARIVCCLPAGRARSALAAAVGRSRMRKAIAHSPPRVSRVATAASVRFATAQRALWRLRLSLTRRPRDDARVTYTRDADRVYRPPATS